MRKVLEQGKEVLEQIEKHHYDAFFVGGCVRDSILHKEIKDVDIATSATPEEVMEIFPNVIPVGVEHGTVIVRHKGVSYEVTTFRSEAGYSNQRHPDEVVFISDIKEDLARRDFTINAMAMDRFGNLIDPYGGRKDLQAHVIRTVGHPEERFKEDSLRIIRALRFSSQLGFSIEEETLNQMMKLKEQLEKVSVERMTGEMSKFFQGNAISKGQTYLKQTGISMHLPLFKDDPNLIHSLPRLTVPFQSLSEVIALMYILYPSYAIHVWVREWKCSNKEKKLAQKLVDVIQYTKDNEVNNWVAYQLEESYIPSFIRLASYVLPKVTITTKELLHWKSILPLQRKEDLCVNGSDITALFPNYRRGAWIGEMIQQMEYKIVMGELNNIKMDMKEWILCHPPVKN